MNYKKNAPKKDKKKSMKGIRLVSGKYCSK